MRRACCVGVAGPPGPEGARGSGWASAGLYDDPAVLDRMLAEAIVASGLGIGGDVSPLGQVIDQGATVFLKPNWVYHVNESGAGTECLNTHAAFILAVVRAAAACLPASIVIGDSPIQGCHLEQITGEGFAAAAQAAAGKVPVEVRDLRKVRLPGGDPGRGREPTGRKDDDYVLFDLGAESLLEPISLPEGRFRVTMYDPRALARTHRPGVHQYVLCREAFESDVVINLPKLKTHRKAGVTIALKNLVGLNGNKDYLPHHRVGGSAGGGDCYEGSDPLRRMAEWCLDRANGAGDGGYGRWRRRADRLLGWNRRLGRPTDVEGGWYGNDTCWRMALDLNRLLIYGCPDGTIAGEPQRQILSLVDAIVAGQGEGPLAPEPLDLGLVLAGDDSPALDRVGAALLGLDPDEIPLVRHAFDEFACRLTTTPPALVRACWKGRELDATTLASHVGARARPPEGWLGHCELAAVL